MEKYLNVINYTLITLFGIIGEIILLLYIECIEIPAQYMAAIYYMCVCVCLCVKVYQRNYE